MIITMDDQVSPAMIERLLAEGVISVTSAARTLPSCRTAVRCAEGVTAWIRRGKRGIKLEGFFGSDGTWWTSLPALARFFAALTNRKLARPGIEQPERLRRRHEAALKGLAELNGDRKDGET